MVIYQGQVFPRTHTRVLDGGLRVSDSGMLLPKVIAMAPAWIRRSCLSPRSPARTRCRGCTSHLGTGSKSSATTNAAVGVVGEISPEVHWISELILHPRITYQERSSATAAAQAKLHELAHKQCFIANTDSTGVTLSAPSSSPSVLDSARP